MRHFAQTIARTFAIAAITFCSIAAADDYGLPSIGQSADNVLSPAQEKQIGQRVVSQLLQRGFIEEDPEITEYINRIGWRLASRTDRAPSDFNFYLIDDTGINAFALPGGYIGINAGLIMEADNESQLAGVTAHEIAHVTQRHIARQIEATQGLTWVTAAAALLAIIAGGGNPAVIQAAITLGAANIGQQQINFTRTHELEADRLGIRTLAAASYDPNGMAGFFEHLEKRTRLYGNRPPEILLTHPISTTRISEAESRARNYRDVKIREYDDFEVMRARTRVLSTNQPSEIVRFYEEQLKQDEDNPALLYGHALALVRVGRAKAAVETLRTLNEIDTNHPHFALALADAREANGDVDGALTTLSRIEAKYPTYRPLILAYAKALIDNGQAGNARAYLLKKSNLLANDDQTQRLLALAADQLDRAAEAHYRQAEYFHIRGEYAASVHQLQSALALPDISSQDKSRVIAALSRYRKQCEAQYSERDCRESVERVIGRR